MDIETPFPIEGTITPRENGYSANLDAPSEWLTETEHGDMLQRAVDRAAREHGNDVTVEVMFYSDGHGVCNDYALFDTVSEQ